MSQDCSSWINDSDALGPFHIDYLYFYQCKAKNHFFVSLLLLAWVAYLIRNLGSTASNYFSPTLSSVCNRMKIRYDVAGVTFLAFGNGAPDVFSSITSFSGNADELVGVSALLGGSFFISTVVVGSIAILCPSEVSARFFLRDIIFHIIAVTTLSVAGFLGKVNLIFGAILFLIYIFYVSIVIYGSFYNIPTPLSVSSQSSISSGIQAAYWHKDASKASRSSNIYGNNLNANSSFSSLSQQDHDETIEVESGYKFLIVDEADKNDENEEITINLSGAMNHVEFNCEIIEDYCGSKPLQSNNLRISEEEKNLSSTKMIPFDISLDELMISNLTESLMPTSDQILNQQQGYQNSNQYKGALAAMYWQQKGNLHRIRKSISSSEFFELSFLGKFFFILELPVIFLRDITIPTVDESAWNKYYAILHPICGVLFIITISGNFDKSVIKMPIPLFSLLFTIPVSIVVYIFTHQSKPPSDFLFVSLWNIFGFIMSVSWIYALASELVQCLSSMGDIFQISPSFLGLTLLAWGNSTGDLFSNTAIAQKGLGELALAGCYGGPVFNILIGLGISFSYVCIKSYPTSFPFKLDTSSKVSIVFLYFSLFSTLLIVWFRGFKLEKKTGIFLISLYIIYTVIQLILLIFN